MSGGIGVSAPTDPVQAFLADIANLRSRIADLERAAQRSGVSAGDVFASVRTASYPGALVLDASTVIGGQFTFPVLWLVIPASWKSGSNIVLPDARGRTIVGAGTGAGLTARTLSSVFGEETHLLTGAESGIQDHAHTINPPPTDISMPGTLGGSTDKLWNDYGPGSDSGAIPNLLSSSGFANAAFVDIAAFNSANSGAFAATNAHNNVQPSIAFNWFVRT